MAPTRELALQIHREARQYAHTFGLTVACAYGGGQKYEQQKALESGAEICVCTPGRIIDLVKTKATDFLRTSFLVFDEADRLFELGFGRLVVWIISKKRFSLLLEQQVRSISDHVRPDRQALMFSATFPPKIEKLSATALSNPVKVLVGEVGEANTDVIQHAYVLPSVDAKWNWLFTKIVEFCACKRLEFCFQCLWPFLAGKVLVFVTKKLNAEIVAEKLKLRSINLTLLHGDMLQAERNERLRQFKADVKVLVATDVAGKFSKRQFSAPLIKCVAFQLVASIFPR